MYVCGFCRRQESQQSNASTSSLPSLPDNLPDLSTQGYTIPRLKTPSLKRSINIANLTDLEWEESEERGNMKKRPRHEAHYNSISSSLSSMRRMKIKQVNVMFTLHVFTCILDIWSLAWKKVSDDFRIIFNSQLFQNDIQVQTADFYLCNQRETCLVYENSSLMLFVFPRKFDDFKHTQSDI